MRELEKQQRDSEKERIESVVKKQQQIEFKYLGNLRPLRGHILWKINIKTLEISQATYRQNKTITWHEAVNLYVGIPDVKEVIVEQGFEYISALTKEKALERYMSGKGSAKMNDKKSLNIFDN
jgi:hypothetical protein